MHFIDKHIDAQVEAYKANRHENSDSKGMRLIRGLFKRDDNKNHQSVFSSNQNGRQGSNRLEVRQHPDSNTKRN